MLVLNTNKGGNSAFIQNNSFMDGYAPDFDNSLVLSPDRSKTVSIDGNSFFQEETLIAPYCLIGNADGNNCGKQQSYTTSGTSLATAKRRAYEATGLRTGNFSTQKGDANETNIKMISNFIFKGGETVGKRIIANFRRDFVGTRWSVRNASGTLSSTPSFSNIKVTENVEIGLYRNGAFIEIATYKRDCTNYAGPYNSNFCSPNQISKLIADTSFDVQGNGATAQNGDRLYIRFYSTREYDYSIDITGNRDVYLLYGKAYSDIDFGARGHQFGSYQASSVSCPYYNGNNTLSNMSVSYYYYNGVSANGKRYIQVSID